MLIFNRLRVFSLSVICMFLFSFIIVDIVSAKEDLNEKLFKSIEKGMIDEVKSLIKAGADINSINSDNLTTLMIASGYGRSEIVRFLVKSGMDVNGKNSTGVTALIIASSLGKYQVVKDLIDLGADVNLKNNKNITALMMVAYRGD